MTQSCLPAGALRGGRHWDSRSALLPSCLLALTSLQYLIDDLFMYELNHRTNGLQASRQTGRARARMTRAKKFLLI